MQASTGVLRVLNREVGGVERVEDVVEGLRVEMGRVKEVGNVIGEGVSGELGVDDAEVEDELVALENEERERREKVEAEEVRRRFEAVEKAEEERKKTQELQHEREGMQVQERARDKSPEKEIEESIQGLDRMSLDQERPTPLEDKIFTPQREPPKAVPAD